MSKEEMDKEKGMCKKCGSKSHKTEDHEKKAAKGEALKKRSKKDHDEKSRGEMAKVDAPGSKGDDIKR